MKKLALLALVLAAMAILDGARAAHAFDQCRIYGYPYHSRAYGLCRMNLRHYWTTGPCGDPSFAAVHREYCHLNPPPFFFSLFY